MSSPEAPVVPAASRATAAGREAAVPGTAGVGPPAAGLALRGPPGAGIGLRGPHFAAALAAAADPAVAGGLWFEVHAENYMVAGGPRLAALGEVRARFPLSLHGVGMSLAADCAPDPAHLRALRRLVDRIDPFVVSEHLAWSRWRGRYRPDLLPAPRSRALLARVADNVAMAQDALGRRLLVENPAHYLRLRGHEYAEVDFLGELARRSGCGLLLDVGNVAVSAHNLGFDAGAYLDTFPGELVGEIHLAGYSVDPVHGAVLRIDSHATPVADDVFALFARVVHRIGARLTLVERDADLPPFAELLAERARAGAILVDCAGAAAVRGRAAPVPCARDEAEVACGRADPLPRERVDRVPGRAAAVAPPGDASIATLANPGDFQDAFARALAGDGEADARLHGIAEQPGFAVYRNTVLAGAVDALEANFPAVARLAGTTWFRAAAASFARLHPPVEPALVSYGAGFADHVGAAAAVHGMPWLAGVAEVDRLWIEALVAADEPPLAAAELAALPSQRLAACVLRPHAAARWLHRDFPVRSLWRANREDVGQPQPAAAPPWQPEGVLVARPHAAVGDVALTAAGCAFLDACAAGRCVAEAAGAALARDAGCDLAALLGGLLTAGAFAGGADVAG
jgi:hypothetical protein